MLRHLRWMSFHWLAATLLLVVFSGCGDADPASFTPEADRAKQALEASLTAWQSGKKPEEVSIAPDASGAVRVVDSDWSSGKKLQSFTIQDQAQPEADAAGDSAARQFSVRLQFAGSSQPLDATYHVVGKETLWVFRDKDYAQSQGM